MRLQQFCSAKQSVSLVWIRAVYVVLMLWNWHFTHWNTLTWYKKKRMSKQKFLILFLAELSLSICLMKHSLRREETHPQHYVGGTFNWWQLILESEAIVCTKQPWSQNVSSLTWQLSSQSVQLKLIQYSPVSMLSLTIAVPLSKTASHSITVSWATSITSPGTNWSDIISMNPVSSLYTLTMLVDCTFSLKIILC